MKKINTPDKLDTLSPQANPPSAGDTLSTLFFYFAILIFIIGFNFTDAPPPSGWYQQFMPNLNNKQLKDITFIDSIIGYAITGYTTVDTNYILKTSNGGDNWIIINTVYAQLTRVQFLNSDTGFVSGGNIQGGYLIKTINGGMNWDFVPNSSFTPRFEDISVFNQDTIWVTSQGGPNGGIFRTTNGGLNWDTQYYQFNNNPKKIYMYNRNIGFACTDFELFKTTNSGLDWIQISGSSQSNQFYDIYFVDSLTGWKSSPPSSDTNMMKTTDGGFNWILQTLPHGGLITVSSGMGRFSKISKDTIWGTNGALFYGSGRYRGILWFTSNSGSNWNFQLPDTMFSIPAYFSMDFVNPKIGWSYTSYYSSITNNIIYTGIHTTIGGDTNFYTPVNNISSNVPKQYLLFQNYPNPFNPRTKINYQISKSKERIADIKLIVYDITGKEAAILVNQKLAAGIYETEFDGSNYSSGVYFYSLFVDNQLIDTKKMILLK